MKLSTSHEEELVDMAIKLSSPMKGIKWYYETYRPEDFKRHNKKRDWKKNCRLCWMTVKKWMTNFNKVGYHRPNKIRKIGQLTRPKEGINRIQPISLTENQKNILVQSAIENKKITKTIKAFVQVHFPKEYTNHENYNDWERCSINKNKVAYWVRNVKNLGCTTRPTPKYSSKKREKKLEEELLRAKGVIEEFKKQCKNKLDMGLSGYEVMLTGPKLAAKMGVSRSTGRRYLNILEKRSNTLPSLRLSVSSTL